MSLGVENVFVLVSGSKLTWILCDVRPQTDMTGRYVGYVLEDHSVTVDWLAKWFILYKRTKEVLASNYGQG